MTSLVSALSELYGLSDEGITEDSWEELDHEIRRRHADSGWVDDVIARAGIERIVTDPFSNVLLDARASLGPRYRSVARVNCLAVGWHADSHDHNGNSAHTLAVALDAEIDSFDGYLSFLERFVDTLSERGQVALKSALAYDRDLRFDEPDEGLARSAFGNRRPSPGSRRRSATSSSTASALLQASVACRCRCTSAPPSSAARTRCSPPASSSGIRARGSS